MTKSAVVGVHEAKTHLSRLVERVEAGEEIEISRRGAVVARLVPALELPDDFDAPMDDEWLDLFYNGPIFPVDQR